MQDKYLKKIYAEVK